jgi:hypothetical protein
VHLTYPIDEIDVEREKDYQGDYEEGAEEGAEADAQSEHEGATGLVSRASTAWPPFRKSKSSGAASRT